MKPRRPWGDDAASVEEAIRFESHISNTASSCRFFETFLV